METSLAEDFPVPMEENDSNAGSWFIPDGVYLVMNSRSRTALDLLEANPAPGAGVVGWEYNTGEHQGNQRWVIKHDEITRTYTLRNLKSGTYLNLPEGNRASGTRAVGWPHIATAQDKSNQEWRIEKVEPHIYTIRPSKVDTFLEVADGSSANRTTVQCSEQPDGERGHQTWWLDRVSRSCDEIVDVLKSWKQEIVSQVFHPYGDSALYIGFSTDLLITIWRKTDLGHQPILPHLFDYDDFVTKFKDAVKTWARKQFEAASIHGYAVLCGIIHGEAQKGPKAYNWCLTSDMRSLLFFDPQTGREYSSAALDSFGFEPKLVLL